MAAFVVTTTEDVVDPEDGVLSLREAIAASNASGGEDSITFADHLFTAGGPFGVLPLEIEVTEGMLTVSEGQSLSILGDWNNDGISDIVLNGTGTAIFEVRPTATLALTGMDLIGTNVVGAAGEDGEGGANGEDGTHGRDLDPDYHVYYDWPGVPDGTKEFFFGDDGSDGTEGTSGERGADGLPGETVAGGIVNYGTLVLTRVGLGDLDATGGNAGNGGHGGHGGHGGDGHFGERGANTPNHLFRGDNINGGNGGNGAPGANGGAGGDGGEGGSAAGAILNKGTVILQDVVFGGTLTSGYVEEGSTGYGMRGGDGGLGGDGGNGGSGGDGGWAGGWSGQEGGSWGLGGDAGNAGNGGNAGAFGTSGDAAGAILNEGSIAGTAALFGNSAQVFDMRDRYDEMSDNDAVVAGGYGGLGAKGGIDGKRGVILDYLLPGGHGIDVEDGINGLAAARPKEADNGEQNNGILNRDGGNANITASDILVYAHPVDVSAGEDAGDRTVTFNIIRLGSAQQNVDVAWSVRGHGANGVTGAAFEGGVLPSGTVTLAPVEDGFAYHFGFATTVSFTVAADVLAGSAGEFEIVLTSAAATGGLTARLGTASLVGAILGNGTPPDDGENPPDDGENPPDDGENPPDDGENPPDDGENPPDDGENPPDDGNGTPGGGGGGGGGTPPSGGGTPGNGGDGGETPPPAGGGDGDAPSVPGSPDFGGGAQALAGTAAELFGRTVLNFGADDTIRFTDGVSSLADLIIDGNVIRLASAGAGSAALTLEGDLTDGRFFLLPATEGGGSELFFAKNLADAALADGQAVPQEAVNGAPHPALLTGDGERSFKVTLSDKAIAALSNALGVYEIDAGGNIVDARILFSDVKADPNATISFGDVEAGHQLGFFIVNDGLAGDLSDIRFVNGAGEAGNVADGAGLGLMVGGVRIDADVFHAFSSDLNGDGLTHLRSGADPSGSGIRMALEDLFGAGDSDFQDVVFTVDVIGLSGDSLL